jgi:hypothetical protein
VRLTILAALVAVTSAGVARAECTANGIQFFPSPGSVIPTNARFILEGVGTEQQKVLALIGQQLVFKANDDIVTAKVLRGWRSEMNRAAVLLIPNHPFRPNKRYTLILGALASSPFITDTTDVPYWDAGAWPDDKPPRWMRKPAVAEGQYILEGGKLTRFIRITMQMEEQSPAYLVITLQRAHGSTSQQTYFTPVRDGKAMVGHDSCSGGFVFEDGKSYRATVLGYDIAGNLASTVQPFEFAAPKPGQR